MRRLLTMFALAVTLLTLTACGTLGKFHADGTYEIDAGDCGKQPDCSGMPTTKE